MKIEQASEEDWKEICNPTSLCIMNFYPLDLSDRYGIKFFEFIENGLGWLCASVIKINEIYYWLFAAFDPDHRMGYIKNDPDSSNQNREALKVSVRIRSYEPDPMFALTNLCEAFDIAVEELYWKNENVGLAQWILTRLDDNGNEMEMYRFHDEQCAKWVQQKYQNKGHKQAYFIKKGT
jgi:hypothetical protein